MRPRSFLALPLLLVATVASYAQTPFWEPSRGPYGAPVQTLAVARDGSIIVGTSGGLWRSTDDGRTWTMPQPELHAYRVYAVLTLANGDVIAAMSGNTAPHYVTMARSTDHGATWTADSAALTGVWQLALDEHGDVYARQSRDIRRSSDHGRRWTRTTPQTMPIQALFVLRSDTIVVRTELGRYLSRDSGATWTLVEWPGANYMRDGNGVLFAGSGHSFPRSMHRSLDGGATWISSMDGADSMSVDLIGTDRHGRMLAITHTEILRWDEVSARWQRLAPAERGMDHGYVRLTPTSLILGGAAGVYRSTDDGASWDLRAEGMTGTYVPTIVVDPDGTILAPTVTSLYRSTDVGATWQRSAVPFEMYDLVRTDAGTLVASEYYAIHRSTDDGSTWMTQTIDSVFLPFGRLYYSHGVAYSLGSVVTRSTDDGVSWQTLRANSSIGTVTMAFDDEGGAYLNLVDSIMVSDDRGETWSKLIESPGITDIDILRNGDAVLAQYFGGVVLFERATGLLTELRAQGTASERTVTTLRDGYTYIASRFDGSVLRRRIGGDSAWEDVSTGVETWELGDVREHPSGFMFLTTARGGVQRSSARMSAISGDAHSAARYAISPQPASSTLRIDVELRRGAAIVLRTMLGVAVRRVVSDAGSGERHVDIDVGDLPSGLYMCEMCEGARCVSAPVVIAR